MPCCRYICCPCLLCCCRDKKKKDGKPNASATSPSPSGADSQQLVSASVYQSMNDNNNDSSPTNTNSLPEDAVAAADSCAASVQDQQDYEDLQYLATKREIRVTIRTSTKAGVAAGLSVMAGTLEKRRPDGLGLLWQRHRQLLCSSGALASILSRAGSAAQDSLCVSQAEGVPPGECVREVGRFFCPKAVAFLRSLHIYSARAYFA